ncbi:ribosome small subunit-dependent GTPase A [Candidatus Pandoraea novymonadis]|uniref:Small ribosomal subunit biogenesis GTPase RsgA n=1 Tax=Candidatus Pandoraea novymonadis TaxID=1808959 RepID=A0ABX5FE79_9BURK|nr:ribosome small subunit-dependent GTPase A [Candidatus Pandoraea novymonadis]PSB91976.1 putative ribosome biogenesis GTPase RsgA [Candidatus Pandoraea novymonadis]
MKRVNKDQKNNISSQEITPNIPLLQGCVVAAHGRHYVVKFGAENILCFPRGKHSKITVGDQVTWARVSINQGVIEDILPRRKLLHRSDQFKSKLFAANIDQLLISVATEPYFSEDFLGRALVAAEVNDLKPIVILNKIDITKHLSVARDRLALYCTLGYKVLDISIRDNPADARAQLLPYLNGQSTLLLGQSGVGKSTLINLLVPNANVATREISTVINSGKHTTTFTQMFHLSGGGTLIDSPGFQEFGLYHLNKNQLEQGFPEFRGLLNCCRFYNCYHLKEPGCAILQALVEERIQLKRYTLYVKLVHESKQKTLR